MDDGPVGCLSPPQADASRRSRTTDQTDVDLLKSAVGCESAAFARYTSPLPPAPRTPITSYGPIREPRVIAMTDEPLL